eukprot:TRINITY_DN5992_c0_g1_i4.p1 TRINITY_DN5992_c0_g1~~TRINITY_DN5992_c0_g1_i4.p1  ORF type:complete len:492 (+),score=105.18 TRINITY_DN5992_c0_g1_i4:1223-2698(+)
MRTSWSVLFSLFVLSLAVVSAVKPSYKNPLRRGLEWRKLNGLYTAEEPSDLAPSMWVNQPVDHFNPSNTQVWQQKYYINDTFWDKANSGPIFVLVGGEGPASPMDVSGEYVINNYAQQFGAMVISVEHRFYGDSMPLPDLSVESLQYLTSAQALADFANFQKTVTAELGLEGCTWISFGGSYSGSLSAWFRLKYPSLIAGAIASSAPVNPVVDFFEYFQVVQNSIGPQCAARVQNVTNIVGGMLNTTKGRQQLQVMFNTCDPIVSDLDVATFMSELNDGICETVQYNYDNRPVVMNIPTMCDILLTGTTEEEMMAAFLKFYNIYNDAFGGGCTEVNYEALLYQMKDTDPFSEVAAARSWTWQTCIEFGYFQTGDSNNQPFGDYITLDWFLQQCQDLFGTTFTYPNIQWTYTNYGGSAIASSNIVFPNGSIDPWHILGVLETDIPSETTLLMNGTAHCSDLFTPSPYDLPDLVKTRQIEVEQIQAWLSGPTC